MSSFFGALFGTQNKLSNLDSLILDSIRARLDTAVSEKWDRQIGAINKIQRLPEGVEVNFYRMKNGRPTFDLDLAFPNKTAELQVAKVEVGLTNVREKLVAIVWSVNGFLFSIEYQGSINYFEEAAGMDTHASLILACDLASDLGICVPASN